MRTGDGLIGVVGPGGLGQLSCITQEHREVGDSETAVLKAGGPWNGGVSILM